MQILITLCKILLLFIFAAITLGWGACGALGLAVTFDSHQTDWTIIGLTLGGFILMGLFGWGTWKLLRVFFSRRPGDGQGGTGLSA